MAVFDVTATGWTDDAAYRRLGVGTYVGAGATVPDDVYGTRGFVSAEPRAEPVADREIALVEMLAEWASDALAHRSDRLSVEPSIEPTEPPVPRWPGEVDTLMGELGARPRRFVLCGLLEGSIEDREDGLSLEGWQLSDVVALEHNHLPRLADVGYIEWDRETGAITEGPTFDSVGWALRCLADSVEEVTWARRPAGGPRL
jgi:hypothetical protein